ncbi:E3 ubiquitin-protein ligase SINA-like 4 [Aegilops tauschii subsp. strangulata]|uniref:E3 ubiquitin-protein ligase SINA-like 4 n=1 Tax=Aegilops tauschii subsp. strangulata TaxID=200361 RepID=UPI00098ACAB1|nr:E3 ubiquitin-protein ligase SINA-like 4 [Aegilops tauschii subsp. strangulata]
MAKKAGAERDAAAESCAQKKARIEYEAKAAASKITVNLDHKLLECSACCSPLAPPLFQCTNGHIACSECRTNAEYSCSLCAEPANTRCDIMERVLGGMTAPCSFREFGCSATIPFTKKLTHEESCLHAPCHCPIPYCRLYANRGQCLREHIETKHCLVPYGDATFGSLSPVRVCDSEPARLVFLDARAVFLLVVERSGPSGRAVSVVQLVSEPVKEEEEEKDFKYKIQVHTRAGVLSLSGETQSVGRLMRPYQAAASLFVSDFVWSPQDSPVYLEFK